MVRGAEADTPHKVCGARFGEDSPTGGKKEALKNRGWLELSVGAGEDGVEPFLSLGGVFETTNTSTKLFLKLWVKCVQGALQAKVVVK